MGVEQKYDWNLIRSEYVYGFSEKDMETGFVKTTYPTFEQLALKYNCPRESISQKSTHDPLASWNKQRAEIKKKLREKLNSEELNTLFSDSVKYDLMNLKLAENTFKLLGSFYRPYIDMIDNDLSMDDIEEENRPRNLTTKDMESLSRTLLNLHTLVRNIEGEPINTSEIMRDLIKQDVQENSIKGKELRSQKIKQFIKKQTDKDKRREELLLAKAELEQKLLQSSIKVMENEINE